MIIEFDGDVIFWRGPAPFYFVPVPDEESRDIKAIANDVTYGWGVIPVTVRIGKTEFKTSLFPKGSIYLVPIKKVVQKAESIEEGDTVAVWLEVDMSRIQ